MTTPLISTPLFLSSFFFFLNDTAPTEIYPLPLHAALPICAGRPAAVEAVGRAATLVGGRIECVGALRIHRQVHYACVLVDEKRLRPSLTAVSGLVRSEEHTSELQSRLHLVCRLLLEKKKKY